MRAGAAHEPVGQEHAFLLVVGLLDRAPSDQILRIEPPVYLLDQDAVLFRVRSVEVIEFHQESGQIALVIPLEPRHEFLRRDAGLARAEHDRRAVRVAGAHVDAVVAAQLLEAHPDVGLDVLDQVAHVDGPVGVRQRARDEDSPAIRGHRAS